MKRTTRTHKSDPAPPKRSYLWILTLALFGIIPLLKKCISGYRYNTEIRPILEGWQEKISREEGVIEGDTGRIYMLTASDSIRPGYRWYNGYRSLPNDSLLFRIRLQTPESSYSFSRDTTVGQVVCIQVDTKNDSSNNVRIYGIYFEPGSDEPLRNNMNLRRAIIYAGDTGYRSYFVADSFDKDSSSAQGRLARQRLTRIQQELEKRKMDSFFIKTF
ncbi:MAG: hypothetical protein J7578_15620 [Chitinophagaceae bacterium]|nr:hypothetical protein [Chitinophagaceae bacterium]